MGIMEKMFGKPNPDKPGVVSRALKKISEARAKRNARIDAIRRVEVAVESGGVTEHEQIDHEARELSQKTGVSYEDALAYKEHKAKIQRRNESIKGALKDIVRAGQTSAQNIQKSGMFGSGGSIMKEDYGKGGDFIVSGGRGNGDNSFLDFSRVKGEPMFGSTKQKQGKHHKNKSKHSGKHGQGKQIVINLRG